MFNFFKKKKGVSENRREEQQEVRTAPGTQISYAPDLIDKLKGDHQTLLAIYGEINAAFEAGNYTLVTDKLKAFKLALMDHLLTENVRLYIYLARSFAQDELNGELVKGFRGEMDQIAKVVMAFLSRYETLGVDKELAASFGKDLEGIGAALVGRIEREEGTLYPLYMPSY